MNKYFFLMSHMIELMKTINKNIWDYILDKLLKNQVMQELVFPRHQARQGMGRTQTTCRMGFA